MRFNGKELAALAMQPSHKFDKEGILLMNEKVEHGLFRRSEVSCERWCRLRGNLLFYFKNKDQYSEPAGLVVLEQCEVQSGGANGMDDPLAFTIYLGGGGTVQFACLSESERDSWIQAVHMASYDYIRSQLKSLQEKLTEKMVAEEAEIYTGDAEQSYLELNLSCDNLVCDGDGLPPNPMIVAYIYKSTGHWAVFGRTEVIQRISNPCFLTTVTIPLSLVNAEVTKTKFVVYDVRERLTGTMSVIGTAFLTLESAEVSDIRLKLNCGKENEGPCVGFLSVLTRILQRNTTPPPTSPTNSALDTIPDPSHLHSLYCNPLSRTYRFHAGLGADLSLREIMLECQWCFILPQKIVKLFINEEKEFLAAVASLENLKDVWKKRQKELLESHLHLINTYTIALHEMDSNSGSVFFKPSSAKCHRSLEFVPVNLHLQRIIVQNESLRKNGIYDVQTVGCFAAHTLKYRHGGLSRILTLKPAKEKSTCSADTICVIDGVKKVIDWLSVDLISRLSTDDREGATSVMNDLSSQTKLLKSLMETEMVEEACKALEDFSVRGSEEDADHLIYSRSRSHSLGNHALNGLKSDNENANKPFNESRQLSLKERVNNIKNEDQSLDEATFEPEPWELTQLNIEACVMCMETKVKALLKNSAKGNEDVTNENTFTDQLMPCINKLKQAIECLRKTAMLTHLVHLLMESHSVSKQLTLKHRRDIVFTQIVTAVTIAVATRILTHPPDSVDQFLYHISSAGILCQFEGLLSCQGEEMGMLEDMKVAVEDLMHNVKFYLIPWHKEVELLPSITGTRSALTVMLPVPKSSLDKLMATVNYINQPITATAAFFNIGINEQATFAERESCTPSCMQVSRSRSACMSGPKLPTQRFGDVSVQDQINLEGIDRLSQYYTKVSPKLPQEKAALIGVSLDRLRGRVHLKKSKNVEILHIAARVTREMKGLRFTSCKSAKDRTSMSVTLEQLMVLQEDFNLADYEMHRALDCMRCEGTRRENTLKNSGVRKYAFNSLQLLALHRLYRPPAGTYGNVQT